MRRSGVRFPEAAPLLTRSNGWSATIREGRRGAVRGANRYSVIVVSASRGRSRTRGGVEQLPSGSLRVSVYAGIDPVSKKRHYLVETVPSGPSAARDAER